MVCSLSIKYYLIFRSKLKLGHPKAVEIALQLRKFLDRFFTPISVSTPHLYISTLPWLATRSKLWEHWQVEFPRQKFLSRSIDEESRVFHRSSPPCMIWSMSVSPVGTCFATGSDDGCIRFWDCQSGRRVGDDLQAHRENIEALAFSPDGQCIASGSWEEGQLMLWDTQTHLSIGKPFVGHTMGIAGLDFSLDGMFIVSGSRDNTVRVWDSQTHDCYRVFSGHSDGINAVAFSPDGQQLVSGSDDKTIRMWDINTGKSTNMDGHTGSVRAVAFSPDGSRFASASSDKALRIWDAKNCCSIGDPIHTDYGMYSVEFSPDGLYVAAGTATLVYVWDAKSGSFAAQFDVGGSFSAFSPDGTQIVCTTNYEISIIDFEGEHKVRRERGVHTKRIFSVAYSPDGSCIASASADHTVRIWNSQTGALVSPDFLTSATANRYTRAKRTLKDRVKAVLISSILSQRFYRSANCDGPDFALRHASAVNFVAFSPNGAYLASGDADGSVKIWNGICEKGFFSARSAAVLCGTFSPGSDLLATGSSDGTLFVWDVVSGVSVGNSSLRKESIWCIVFYSDGRRIAFGTGNAIGLYDTLTDITSVLIDVEFTVCSLALSEDGKFLAAGGGDRLVHVWELGTKLPLCVPPFKGHSDTIWSVKFLADDIVVSGSRDGTIRAWNLQTGKAAGRPLLGHRSDICCVDLSSDRTRIISGSVDHTIRVWDPKTFFWEPFLSMCGCAVLGLEQRPEAISDEGWTRTADGSLLLWVPSDCRALVRDTSVLRISAGEEDQPIRVLWDKLIFGSEWTNVRRVDTR
jgi:WD40 repeat protein